MTRRILVGSLLATLCSTRVLIGFGAGPNSGIRGDPPTSEKSRRS